MYKLFVLPALMVFALNAKAATSVVVGDQAPCITLNHLAATGTETERSTCVSEKANQNLVITFFATWCGYCRQDLPTFADLSTKYRDTATFRLIGVDDEADMREFFKNQTFTNYEVAFDPTLSTVEAFGLEGTPTLMVIGPDQKVKYIHVGTISPEELPEVERAISN